MVIYSNRGNNQNRKEFIIPNQGNFKIGDEILYFIIDNINIAFTAKLVSIDHSFDESNWQSCKNYTFPSSILREFIKTKHELS